MPRPIWTGTIAFGLVSIPVKLYSAVSEARLDLDMLDKKDKSQIKFKRVNERTGKEVNWKDIVKGYKLDGNYIVLEDKDFERAFAEKSKRIEISSFVQETDIDPIYYENTYYLEPDPKDAKPYALLRKAMGKSGMVALGTFVMRNKEHLCVIKVFQEALVLSRIHFTQDIRPLSDYKIPAASVKLAPAEVKMAEALIESMRSAFDISDYKDEYTAQLMKFIKAKAKGKKPTVAKQTTKVSDDVSSLLDQLKASLSAPSGKPARKAPAKKSGLKAKPAKRKRKTA
jgi:DNA end-binding protein Ku